MKIIKSLYNVIALNNFIIDVNKLNTRAHYFSRSSHTTRDLSAMLSIDNTELISSYRWRAYCRTCNMM